MRGIVFACLLGVVTFTSECTPLYKTEDCKKQKEIANQCSVVFFLREISCGSRPTSQERIQCNNQELAGLLACQMLRSPECANQNSDE